MQAAVPQLIKSNKIALQINNLYSYDSCLAVIGGFKFGPFMFILALAIIVDDRVRKSRKLQILEVVVVVNEQFFCQKNIVGKKKTKASIVIPLF